MFLAVFASAAAVSSSSASLPEARYVGAERCKLCHRQIYASWRLTPHARGAASLGERAAEACRECHGTDSAGGLDGVQCEACHGPGGGYSPPEVMIDRDKALMAGLVLAEERVCRRCHGSDEPGHRPGFSMPAAVDRDASVHTVPQR